VFWRAVLVILMLGALVTEQNQLTAS
jgi:hypothetical protein